MSNCKTLVKRTESGAEILEEAKRQISYGIDELWTRSAKAPEGGIDVIDMFSGCGGMSAGFRMLNSISPTYRITLAVDLDEDANETYQKNFGVNPERVDIGELAEDEQRVWNLVNKSRSNPNGPLVMIGCAPCQGFSSHRNSKGALDKRNSLFLSFAKIASIVQPDAIIIENVPELLTDRYWPIVEEAREILSESGYRTLLAVHDLAEFGVPQNRYRALMIGMKKPFKMPSGFLKRDQYRTVRTAIGTLPSIKAGEVSSSDSMHFTANHRGSTIETIRAVPHDGGNRPYHAGPECLRRAEQKQGRAAYEDVYGRLWWDRPSITVTAYARNPASGRYVHPEQDRGLSVREAASLQSFPSDYFFSGSFDSKFRQIGNAVPPTFATYLAAHIFEQITTTEEQHDIGIESPVGPSFSRLIPALKAGHRLLDRTGNRSKSEAFPRGSNGMKRAVA